MTRSLREVWLPCSRPRVRTHTTASIGVVGARPYQSAAAGRSSRRAGDFVRRLRTPAGFVAGLVLAHDAVFASDSGLASLNTALASSGHGQVWAIVSIAALVAGAFVIVGSMARLLRAEAVVHRLQAETRAASTLRARGPFGLADKSIAWPRDYSHELRRLWPRLFIGVVVGFLIQENVELLAGQSHGSGLEPILTGHPLAIPVMLLLTFGIAAICALLRRRVAVLASLATALRLRLLAHRNSTRVVARGRLSTGGLLLRDALRLLPQEGRAPPRVVVPATT